jgi:hypothetical protein
MSPILVYIISTVAGLCGETVVAVGSTKTSTCGGEVVETILTETKDNKIIEKQNKQNICVYICFIFGTSKISPYFDKGFYFPDFLLYSFSYLLVKFSFIIKRFTTVWA